MKTRVSYGFKQFPRIGKYEYKSKILVAYDKYSLNITHAQYGTSSQKSWNQEFVCLL